MPAKKAAAKKPAANKAGDEAKREAAEKAKKEAEAAAAAAAALAASQTLWQQKKREEEELAAALAASLITAPKTFASSNFLVAYSEPHARPKRQSQLMEAVHALVTAHAAARGVAAAEADSFFEKLQANAFTSGGLTEVLSAQQLMYIAVRLWTSAERLCGREFCSILNEAIRTDAAATIGPAAMVTQGINSHCVTRRNPGETGAGGAVRWPPSNHTFRGTAMPQCHRDFFTPGKQYRAPMFVATSFDQGIATTRFLAQLEPASPDQQPPHQEPCLWIFHFDGSLPESRRCLHVNFIDRTDGSVGGDELEFLFAPYSVFTVRSVHWEERPLVNEYIRRPHRIEVDVVSDNTLAPLDLPPAPWA